MSKIKYHFHQFFTKEIFNLILLLLSIFLLMQVSGYARMARAFPRLVLIMILVLVGLDFVKAIVNHFRAKPLENVRSGEGEQEKTTSPDGESVSKTRVVSAFLLMFVFPALMYLFGFTMASFIFVLASSWFLGYRNLKRLLLSSVVITGFLYVVFIVIMSSRLPRGLLINLILR